MMSEWVDTNQAVAHSREQIEHQHQAKTPCVRGYADEKEKCLHIYQIETSKYNLR